MDDFWGDHNLQFDEFWIIASIIEGFLKIFDDFLADCSLELDEFWIIALILMSFGDFWADYILQFDEFWIMASIFEGYLKILMFFVDFWWFLSFFGPFIVCNSMNFE